MKRGRIVLFPHAGASGSSVHEWRSICQQADLNPIVIVRPGHDYRIRESVPQGTDELVSDALTQIPTDSNVDYILAGHSFGALLALETADSAVTRLRIKGVAVSGLGVPEVPTATSRLIAISDPADFVVELERLTGERSPALDNPATRDVYLPALIAELSLHESYAGCGSRDVPVPMACLRGAADQIVPRAAATRWKSRCSARFTYYEVEGGHMAPLNDPHTFLSAVHTLLCSED